MIKENMRAHIICDRYLSMDGNIITIGGMQSYFTALSEVLSKEGYSVSIYHVAKSDFKKEYNGIIVYGQNYNGPQSKLPQFLFDKACSICDKENDLIIFGSERWIVKNKGYKCLAIQHGIPWDIPAHYNYGPIKYWIYYIKKAINAFYNIKKVNNVSTLVCVDYNYINWYRALVAYPKVKLKCIPNFSKIPVHSFYRQDKTVRIIFARRLWQYRGTRIFGNTIVRLLTKYVNLFITIAGDGPDESWLKSKFSIFKNVEFIHYSSEDSIKVHLNKQIAVVPTIGSEGTSLSLLEAMAAKCAVICTDVGGLTNIVLDGYNGLIIPSNDENALYEKLSYLIENQSKCKDIAENGYKTVCEAFSFEKWSNEWRAVIKSITKSFIS